MTDVTPASADTPTPVVDETPIVVNVLEERTIIIEEPTTYFDVAAKHDTDVDGWQLANYNGVHNSQYDLAPGDEVKIPASRLPVPSDVPAVSQEQATAQAAATNAAASATVAGAVDALSGIDPASDASADGATPLVVDGGLAPAAPAVAVPAAAEPAAAAPAVAVPAAAEPAAAAPAVAVPVEPVPSDTPIADSLTPPASWPQSNS